eukprot:10867214-Alexandrium_andersonii.AAC.1
MEGGRPRVHRPSHAATAGQMLEAMPTLADVMALAKALKAGKAFGEDCIPPEFWKLPVSYTHLTLPTICSV